MMHLAGILLLQVRSAESKGFPSQFSDNFGASQKQSQIRSGMSFFFTPALSALLIANAFRNTNGMFTLGRAWIWLVREGGKLWQLVPAACLQVVPYLSAGKSRDTIERNNAHLGEQVFAEAVDDFFAATAARGRPALRPRL